MTDTKMLRQYIKKSGYKRTFIANRIGLTYQGYLNKESGRSEFTQSEIAGLCEILHISIEDKERIFFAKEVDNQSTQ